MGWVGCGHYFKRDIEKLLVAAATIFTELQPRSVTGKYMHLDACSIAATTGFQPVFIRLFCPGNISSTVAFPINTCQIAWLPNDSALSTDFFQLRGVTL